MPMSISLLGPTRAPGYFASIKTADGESEMFQCDRIDNREYSVAALGEMLHLSSLASDPVSVAVEMSAANGD